MSMHQIFCDILPYKFPRADQYSRLQNKEIYNEAAAPPCDSNRREDSGN